MQFKDKATTNRTFTKDGYLVVPASLSRLGVFDYHNSELGKGETGVKKIARTEKSLFSDSTLHSFENAPLTLGHPKEEVNATNWKALAVGTMRNVRRENDHLVGEAWIYDADAIKQVQEHGVAELSCGYQCELIDSQEAGVDFEMSPMVGNHIAIVANGRCGNSCKLADEQKEETKMGEKRKFLDTLLGAFGIKLTDEQAKKVEEEEKVDEGKTKPDTPPKSTEKDAPQDEPKDKDKEKKTVNDADLAKQLADAQAEIQRLKDEKNNSETEAKRTALLSDAKASFADVSFADNASVRDIHQQAVISTGIFAKDELATMSDAELAGAYLTAKATAKKLADKALGTALLKDATPAQRFDFNSYNQ